MNFRLALCTRHLQKKRKCLRKAGLSIPGSEVGTSASTDTSAVVYEIILKYRKLFYLKALPAPRRKEESFEYKLRSDGSMCNSMVIRSLVFILILRCGVYFLMTLSQHFRRPFLQSGGVNVISPRGCADRLRLLWLLLAAFYDLFGAIIKF